MPRNAANNAFGGSGAIAQTIAVPHEHPPLRMPSFPNLERTAVVPLVNTGTVAVTASSTLELTLLRSATFPLWGRITEPAVVSNYWSSSGSEMFGPLINLQDVVEIVANPWTSNGAGSTGVGGTYIGRYPLCVLDDGRAFVRSAGTYGTMLQIHTSATAVDVGNTLAITVTFETYDGQETRVVNETFTHGAATHTLYIPAAGMLNCAPDIKDLFWRPVRIVLSGLSSGAGATQPGVVTAVLVGLCSGGTFGNPNLGASPVDWFGPLFEPPEYSANPSVYASMRSTAVALLLSNVTAVLNKEGTVQAARLPRSRTNKYYTTGSHGTFIATASPQERYWGPLEKGLYTFTMPDSSSETFRDYSNDLLTGTRCAIFRPDAFDYVTLISMADLGGTDTTMAYTLDRHAEFRTSSPLFPTGFSVITLESYHLAQMALAKQGAFYENPVHLSAITSLLRGAVTRLAPVVMPHVANAAKAAGSVLLNRAVSALNTRMDQFMSPQRNKQPQRRKLAAKPKPKAKKAGWKNVK